MNSECLRIADQLRRAFAGDPWHGSPLRDLLAGVTAAQAHAHPLASAHGIWDLVLHIDIYVRMAFDATRGIAMPKLFGTEQDWPTARDGGMAWTVATSRLFDDVEQLARTVETFGDARLHETVPGRGYDFYLLFHGIVQHSLYHAGQIALLKRAAPDIF